MPSLLSSLPDDPEGAPLHEVAFALLVYLAELDQFPSSSGPNLGNALLALTADGSRPRAQPYGRRGVPYVVAEGWVLLAGRGLLTPDPAQTVAGGSGFSVVSRRGHQIVLAGDSSALR